MLRKPRTRSSPSCTTRVTATTTTSLPKKSQVVDYDEDSSNNQQLGLFDSALADQKKELSRLEARRLHATHSRPSQAGGSRS